MTLGAPSRLLVLVPACVLAAAIGASAGPERRAATADAFVDFDHESRTWTIGNDGILYAIVVRADGRLALGGMRVPGEDRVTAGDLPDALVTVDGATTPLGSVESGFRVNTVVAAETERFVSMTVHLVADGGGGPVEIERHYVVYPGVPAVEMWSAFLATGAAAAVTNLNAYELTLPRGPVDWVTGLQTATEAGGAFTLKHRVLGPGEVLELGATVMATESALPFFSIDAGDRRVFSGLLWSGAWRLSIEHLHDGLRATFGLPAMSARATADRPIEGPHAFVGIAPGGPGGDAAAVAAFVMAGRGGRPFPSLTTFNTWFVHGIRIDDAQMRRDIEAAADLGLELIQLDAGWYPGDDARAYYDFTAGLGSWEIDRRRFPQGIAPLADYARSRGLKFGVWVEPERVALSTVGRPGAAEQRFLAARDGAYHPGTHQSETPDGQICLGHGPARAWVLAKVSAFLEETKADHLKWDFNRWVVCNREDHDHPPDGGNYAHVAGLYDVLAAIRARFPHLLIENCSGGGHRIDFALARLTDSAWMDDRTAPSAHVRHNLEGLSRVFPAPYLFSYVMAHADEPMKGVDEVEHVARSRMPATMGVAVDFRAMGGAEFEGLRRQVALAKALRPWQADAATHTLTAQGRTSPAWEVIQQVSKSRATSLVFVYRRPGAASARVALRGLDAAATYEIRSADRGRLGQQSGEQLMSVGIELSVSGESGADIIVLERLGPSPARR